MSMLSCPLCGKRSSVSHFDPASLDGDIYLIEVSGLGRGRGFTDTARYSALGDASITQPIADRCREILAMIDGDKAHMEREKLEEIIRSWVDYSKGLEAQVAKVNQELSSSNAAANSYIKAYQDTSRREQIQRQRAEQAESEAGRLRRRIQDIEYKIRRSTNSNLSLEDGVGLLLEG